MRRLREWLPSAEAIRANRWLRWLGPALHHPRLWHMSRRGLALGKSVDLRTNLLCRLARGSAILGEPVEAPRAPSTAAQAGLADENWWRTVTRRFLGVGKPLLLRLAIMAIAVGIATYFLV